MQRWGRAHGFLVGCGRGRQAVETDTERELRELQARMEAMERKNLENTDTSDEEESYENEQVEVAEEVKVMKMMMKASNRLRVEVPMYEGNLNVEELMH